MRKNTLIFEARKKNTLAKFVAELTRRGMEVQFPTMMNNGFPCCVIIWPHSLPGVYSTGGNENWRKASGYQFFRASKFDQAIKAFTTPKEIEINDPLDWLLD